jgi:spore maturation protein CgeB
MFTVLALDDQLDKAVVKQISDDGGTLTANWFCDDHYRFGNYSRYWAPCYNWVITTDESLCHADGLVLG